MDKTIIKHLKTLEMLEKRWFFFAKKNIFYKFQIILSWFEKKQFLIFWAKYSTSAHYRGHTIYQFPESFDILYYRVEMNMLTKYGDQCPLLCSKIDTFRKNPKIMLFSAIFGMAPYMQFFGI
jgi:hypothetical protein